MKLSPEEIRDVYEILSDNKHAIYITDDNVRITFPVIEMLYSQQVEIQQLKYELKCATKYTEQFIMRSVRS